MGFGDKLKGLKDQAQQAVAENKDKIQGAVQVVGDAANTKTRGKYAAKIAKVGEKVEAGVDKFADGAPPASEAGATGAAGAGAAAAPEAGSPTPGVPGAGAAAETPDPAYDIEGNAPQEGSSEAPVTHEPSNPVSPSSADAASGGFRPPPDFE